MRSVIDPRLMSRLRPLVETTMPDTGEVLRNTPTDDGQGGQVDSWATIHTGPVRLERSGWSTEGNVGGQLLTATPWIVTFPALVDIYTKDRIEITMSETDLVRSFEVFGILEPQSYSAETQVLVTELGR